MVRPRLRRRVSGKFDITYFKPAGIRVCDLQCVYLTLDELEAIRLTDFEQLYQAQAAEEMKVSRQTLGNILKSARKKIAEALIQGKAIRIEGGSVNLFCNRFYCPKCDNTFETDASEKSCPECDSKNVEEIMDK